MMHDAPARAGDHGVGMLLVAVLSLGPLLLESRPIALVEAYPPLATSIGEGLAVLGMLGAVAWRIWADRKQEPRPLALGALLVMAAGLMTAWHWCIVDEPNHERQLEHYLGVFNNGIPAPHPLRPLPYGFMRTLERLTGDWKFAALAYRWFFLFWLLWVSYQFARRFLPPPRSLCVVLVVVLFYPLSILYYEGQPTDPMSHTFLVLGMLYIVEDRCAALGGALALGVMAKETALILIPAYAACHWHRGWQAFWRMATLCAVGGAAFLATRLPLGWRPGHESVNGVSGLMVGTNLGIGEPIAFTYVPRYENYLQPALFIGLWLPLIALRWRRLDYSLKALAVTLTPLLFASSLCFSWLYESRNYLPLLPLLSTMALWSEPDASATGKRVRR
jgi:hypothetical protein